MNHSRAIEKQLSVASMRSYHDDAFFDEVTTDTDKTLPLQPTSASDNKPFFSALIDTVRLIVKVKHAPLEDNAHITRNRKGYGYSVPSRFTGISATIVGSPDRTQIRLEASGPNFLTGQNIAGLKDIRRVCTELAFAVLEAAGIVPTVAERAAINAGKFRITRADLVVHCACGSSDRANALMRAVKNMISRYGKVTSAYGFETVYIGQYSKRRTLKVYRKDKLLEKHPLPDGVYGQNFLTKNALGLVRFELVLRRPQLADFGLDSPLAWTPTTLEELLTPWIDKLAASGSILPTTANMDQLPALLRAKLKLWLLGEESAFDGDDWTPATYQKHRRTIRKVTGIDIEVPLSPELQAKALGTIRDMLDAGVGYRDYPDKWLELVEGRK